ncbi:hypothetical protein D3C73_707040 [compost metagenome]
MRRPASTNFDMLPLAKIRSGTSPLAAIMPIFCSPPPLPISYSALIVTPVFSVITLPISSCMLFQFGLASAPKKVNVIGLVSSAFWEELVPLFFPVLLGSWFLSLPLAPQPLTSIVMANRRAANILGLFHLISTFPLINSKVILYNRINLHIPTIKVNILL